jgi:signal transduction histidine kinase
MSKPTIICVDDEPTVLESLKIELKQLLGDSCLIETAESAEEALELFEELQTDQYEVALVLADHIMPGIRGDELLKQIHTRSPQTFGIMVTGHADLEVIGNLIRTAKLHCYIAKPWQSNDLRSTVLEAIQSYRQTRQLEAQNAALQQTVQQLQHSISELRQSEEQLWQQVQQQEALSRVYLAFAAQQSQLFQATQNQIQELEDSNQRKDNFLEAISHELRAPISNIRMATQMLEVRLRQLSQSDTLEQCNRYFQILRTECQREVDLLNDMLDLLRLDSDSDPLNLSTIHLNLWLPHVAEPFIERMREREQQLVIDLPSNLPALTTDLAHLERSLTELLTNAWKYTPMHQTITITAQIVSAASEQPLAATATAPPRLPIPPLLSMSPQSLVWISVTNTGVEIPVEEHERIFSYFYRISNHNFWHQPGTGLGLAIVKKRVEKLHGSIEITNHSGSTTFTIKLPLHPIEPSNSIDYYQDELN